MILQIISWVTWLGIHLVLIRSIEVICVYVLVILNLELYLRILRLIIKWRFVNILPGIILTWLQRLQSTLIILFSWAKVVWYKSDIMHCSGGFKLIPFTSGNVGLTSDVHSLPAPLRLCPFGKWSSLRTISLFRFSSLVFNVYRTALIYIDLWRASWPTYFLIYEVLMVRKTFISPLIIVGMIALMINTLITAIVLLPSTGIIVKKTTCLHWLQMEAHSFRFIKDSLEAVN